MAHCEFEGFIGEIQVRCDMKKIFDDTVGAFMMDPVAVKNLITDIFEFPIAVRDAWYWNKFCLYVIGVKKAQDDLDGAASLGDKLFSDPDKKSENAARLLTYIERADSEKKINYYINATKSLLLGFIDNTEFFRIIKALSETLGEDLEYLSEIATFHTVIEGNVSLLALEKSGLVFQAVIDANKPADKQNYYITSLGEMVDAYSLSLDDENRRKFYKSENPEMKIEIKLPVASKEDISKLFEE